MRKQRVRTLKELYEITQQILEPEITPVLRGSCRIQGPVDEVDINIGTNSAVSPTEKGFGKHYLNEDTHMKLSGTCNVCAAPCSSCMHFNRAISFMESKADGGISENSCRRKDADNCSFSNSEMPPFYKSKPCDDRMQATSETSKMFSTTSSHDSYSENAESKATVKTPDVHESSEGVDMPLKLTSFETVDENQLLVEHDTISHLSREPTNPHVIQRNFSNQEDHHGVECHGDSISCVTGPREVNVAASDLSTSLGTENMPCASASNGALLDQGLKMAAQAQAADGEIVDIQSIQQRSGIVIKEPSQTKGTGSNSLNAQFPNSHSEPPGLNGNPSPKEPSFQLNSKIFCNAGSKDAEENLSSQLQMHPSESFVEPVESSLGGQMTTSGMDEQKPKLNYEMNKASSITIHAPSPGDTYKCLETKSEGSDGNSTDQSTKHGIPSEQHGKPSPLLDTSNVQGPQPVSQPPSEADCPDPDTLEDDVKVCDICGDAGREDLLAICSRCSDGAEHTYCMRIMLNKVPEGDWLCEECRLKDMVTDGVEKSETVSSTLKAPCTNEKVLKVGSTFNPKLLPKLVISTDDVDVPLAVKGLKSPQTSAKRPSGNVDIASLPIKKHSDPSSASMTASPSRKSILSRESSFKNLDAGKAKQGNFVPPSGNQSSNSSQVISRSLTLGSNSTRVQGQLQCSRGSLSRSGSFNSLKPKVKQVIENVPQKPQVTKEYASSETKEGFVRALSKSASCRNMNSGHLSVNEAAGKVISINTHRSEESKNPRQIKERIIERKNSFVFNRTLPSSSPASTPSVSLLRADSKTVQNDGKVNGLPEPNVSHPNRGSEDVHDKVGLRELRKQASFASKTLGNYPSNGQCNLADQRPSQVAAKEDAHASSSADISTVPQRIVTHSCNRDEKFKDSSSLGSSRQLLSPSKRILRCQRCNETGHSTQFCSIDKLKISALKPSAERSSREAGNKGNKWKDVVDAAISKARVQKNLPDQSEEISSTDISSEIISQNHSSSSSSCVKDLSTCEGTTDKQNGLRSTVPDANKPTVNDVKQHALPQNMGTPSISRGGESNAPSISRGGESNAPSISRGGESNAPSPHSDELTTKPSAQILPEHRSLPFDPLGVSALPDHDFIWQGSFEVKRAGKLPERSDGIQAHLSTCASAKVLQVVTKFPDKILLEEVARLRSWPLQFQENCPTEENIALFFFAKDVTSYEKSYSKLLESMVKNDLALKGNFDGIELLIFPSSKLPEKSQRWNRLFFLWGVFKERRSTCSGKHCLQSKGIRSSSNSEHDIHDLPTQLVREVATSEKESKHDKSINTEADDSKNLSFLGAESKKTSNQGGMDSILHPDRNSSHSTNAIDFLTSRGELTGEIFPGSRIQNTAQLILEVKGHSTIQKEFIANVSTRREDDELPVSIQNNNIQASHEHATDGLSAACMFISNPRPPDLNVDSQCMDDVSCESSVKHELSSLPILGAGDVVKSKSEEKITLNPGPPDLNVDSETLEDGYCESTVKHEPSSLSVLGGGDFLKGKDEEKITSNSRPPDLNVDSHSLEDVPCESSVKHKPNFLPVLQASDGVRIKDEEKMDKDRVIEKGAASDSVRMIDKTEDIRWVSGLPNKKRARSHSPEQGSQPFGVASVSTSAEVLWRRSTVFTSLEEERESKKMKVLPEEALGCRNSRVDNFGNKVSSKVHPVLPTFPDELHLDRVHSLPLLPESSRSSERYFFPLDSCSVMDSKSGSLIPLQILSSDDEYDCGQEADAPNLELALGAKKQPVKQEILPLSLPPVDRNKNQGKRPNLAAEEGDDESGALSLSLAFPFSGKEQVPMPVSETQPIMRKRSQVNTSLLLFGSFADS